MQPGSSSNTENLKVTGYRSSVHFSVLSLVQNLMISRFPLQVCSSNTCRYCIWQTLWTRYMNYRMPPQGAVLPEKQGRILHAEDDPRGPAPHSQSTVFRSHTFQPEDKLQEREGMADLLRPALLQICREKRNSQRQLHTKHADACT